MDFKKGIEEIKGKNYINYVGFAPISRFEKAPPTHHPTDFLPKAKTVIVLGINLSKGVLISNKRAYAPNMRHAFYPFLLFGYVLPNNVLNHAAFEITCFLESLGYPTLPVPTAFPNDPLQMRGMLSSRHAAVAAGVGEFGWMNPVITPHGPRVRLVSVITEAEIEPSPLYEGPKICAPERCGFRCVKVCPVNALSEQESVTVEIGGRTFEYSRFDRWSCRWGVRGFNTSTFGRKDIAKPEVITPEIFQEAQKQLDPWQNAEVVPLGTVVSFCNKCVMECPVGRKD